MTNVVWYIFSAGGAAAFSLVAALWVVARPSSRAARRVLVAVTLGYALAATYFIGHGVDRLVAAGFEPFSRRDAPAGRTAIVVLGSGAFTAVDWEGRRFTSLDIPASTRVVEAARVFRITDAEWVISSGGLAGANDEPSGTAMRDALVRLGVPSERILVEIDSLNTRDEAMIVGRMLKDLTVQHTILVTSDIHMRRSVGTFRAAGIEVIPAIARHRQDDTSWQELYLPTSAGMRETGDAAHEILGIAYYAVRGWYAF